MDLAAASGPTASDTTAPVAPAALLRDSYRRCARITARHGRTYAAAARLLPAADRRHVHAVYAFCRVADDVVDDATARDPAQRAADLAALGERLHRDLAAGGSDDPLLAAVVASALRTGIDPACFDRFLASMRMDLHRTTYETWDDLWAYMDGSAAVIGEMMLPVLGGHGPVATHAARSLGVAFQLTNFLRDVGEDLDRGRVYLPQEELARFGADPWRRTVDEPWRELLRFQIARARDLYAQAEQGIAVLPGRGARCVWTARVLYARILDRIEAADFDVFTRRAVVPTPVKLAVAARGLLGPRPGPTPA